MSDLSPSTARGILIRLSAQRRLPLSPLNHLALNAPGRDPAQAVMRGDDDQLSGFTVVPGLGQNARRYGASMKGFITLSFLVIAMVAGAVAVKADAISDQKKAYKNLGIDVGKNQPALCHLLSKVEVERFIGKPVRDGTSAGPAVTGCAWHAADGSNDGVLVTRVPRDSWYPPTTSKSYKKVSGIGEQAYTNYMPGVGYEANALSAKGVTTVLLSGKGSAGTAVDALRIVIKR